MAESTSDPWQLVFFGIAALIILFQALRGWQLGVGRQIVQVVALVAAYPAAWVFAPFVTPHLQSLGLPNPVVTAFAGVGIAALVYIVITFIGSVLFKKTADHSIAAVRLGYGMAGALVGVLFGGAIVFVAAVGVRLLGSVADAEIDASRRRNSSVEAPVATANAPASPGWMHGIAGLKHSIENGPVGPVVQQLDPLPGTVYTTIQKIGEMTASQNSLQRFMNFPGVRPIAEHPKIQTLQKDPGIARAAAAQDIFALLRNPNIVAAVNDPEIATLLRKLEFEKALDYALANPEKPEPAPQVR